MLWCTSELFMKYYVILNELAASKIVILSNKSNRQSVILNVTRSRLDSRDVIPYVTNQRLKYMLNVDTSKNSLFLKLVGAVFRRLCQHYSQ